MSRPAPARPLAPLSLLLATLILTGCAGDVAAGDYPSLARRPAEGMGFGEPALPPAPPLVADPKLDAGIATLRDRLGTIAAGFARDAAVAERAGRAARGAAVGSEGWLTAQSALAQLDDWRAQVTALASEADELAAARAARLEAPYAALTAVSDTIRTEGERQTATILRIQALTPMA